MNCAHFGLCGGCEVRGEPASPAPYEEQLQTKENRVRQELREFTIDTWRPIVAAPAAWRYRNKMEFAFAQPYSSPPDVWREDQGGGGPGLVLGLRQAGRYDRIVDLQSCALISEEAFALLERTRAWGRAQGLSGYHRKRHQGDLRYLVVREGKNTGQRMAVLLMTPRQDDGLLESFKDVLAPLATTGWVGFTDTRGDVARAEDMRLLWGPGTIEERLGRLTYQISPYSFFQTNTWATEKLYALLRQWASPHPASGHPLPSREAGRERDGVRAGVLLDLYCGSGGIALALADRFERVIGVDTNRDAIADAALNAKHNGITNTEFLCEDALEFLKKLPASKVSVQLSAMVVDPPRAGLHPRALSALIEMNPARLAYVSCNPESLGRDLKALAPLYHIRSVQPVDLFPNTPHVETLALMESR